MKIPQIPKKPYPPRKPQKPSETVNHYKTHEVCRVSHWARTTANDISSMIKQGLQWHNLPEDTEIEITSDYDNYSGSGDIIFSAHVAVTIPNPYLAHEQKRYESDVKQYAKNLEKYEQAQSKYEKDLAEFTTAKSEYDRVQKAKEIVKLEKRLKQLKNDG